MRWINSTSAKDIGMLYIIIGLLGGLIGTGLSIIIRIELSDIGQVIITNNQIYNVVITGHALLMIFYFIMPSLIGGFGNIFIPIQIGALDMAFPRLNNVSLWLLCVSLMMILLSSIVGEGVGTGWTIYPPLSSIESHSSGSVDIGIFGLHLAGISSMLGAINFIVTIINLRAPGLYYKNLTLLVWSLLVTAILLLLSLPILASIVFV